MTRIFDDNSLSIGRTPLVRLKRIGAGRNNTLLVKLEGNNPAGSVKDRPALFMIRRAAERGEMVVTFGTHVVTVNAVARGQQTFRERSAD